MADWAKEMLKLSSEICINTIKVRNIVSDVDL